MNDQHLTHDEHVQHVWNLTHDEHGETAIELWTDGYTVRVLDGPDDGDEDDRGRTAVDALLTRYAADGWRIASDYAVNAPYTPDAGGSGEDESEPDGKPELCPECSSPVVYEPRHCTDLREGAAWLCTGCRWGQFLTA